MNTTLRSLSLASNKLKWKVMNPRDCCRSDICAAQQSDRMLRIKTTQGGVHFSDYLLKNSTLEELGVHC